MPWWTRTYKENVKSALMYLSVNCGQIDLNNKIVLNKVGQLRRKMSWKTKDIIYTMKI